MQPEGWKRFDGYQESRPSRTKGSELAMMGEITATYETEGVPVSIPTHKQLAKEGM